MPNNSPVVERITQINDILKQYYDNLQKKKEIALMTKMYFSPNEDNPDENKYKNLIDKFVYPNDKRTPIYNYNDPKAQEIIKELIGLKPFETIRLPQQQQQDFDNTSIREPINVSVRELIDSVNQFNGLLDSIPENIDESNLRDYVVDLDKFQNEYDDLVKNFIDSTKDILDLLNRNIDTTIPQGQDIESNIDTSINTEISNFQTSAEALYKFLNTTQYLDGNIRNIRPADYSTDFKNVLTDYTDSINNFIKLLNEKKDIHKQQNNNAIPPDYLDTLNTLKTKFVDSKTKFIDYLDSLENKGNQVFQKDATNLQRLLLTEQRNRFIASANEFLKFHKNEEDTINSYKKQIESGISSLNPQLGISNTNLESLEDYKKMFLTKTQKFIELLNKPNKYKSQKEQSSSFSINFNIQDYLSSTEKFKDLIETVNKDPTYKRTKIISDLIKLLRELQHYITTTLAIEQSQSAANNTTKQENYVSNLTKHRDFFNTRDTIIVGHLDTIIDILTTNTPLELKQKTNSQQNTNSQRPKSILNKNINELLDYLIKLEKTSIENDKYINELSENLTSKITSMQTASKTFQEFLNTSLSSANTKPPTSSVNIKELLETQKEKHITYINSIKSFNKFLDDELKKIKSKISSANSNINANTSQIFNTYETHVQNMQTTSNTFQEFLNTSITSYPTNIKDSQELDTQINSFKDLTDKFNTKTKEFEDYINKEHSRINDILKMNDSIQEFDSIKLVPYIENVKEFVKSSDNFLDFLKSVKTDLNIINNSPSSYNDTDIFKKIGFVEYMTILEEFIKFLEKEDENIKKTRSIPKLNEINTDAMKAIIDIQRDKQRMNSTQSNLNHLLSTKEEPQSTQGRTVFKPSSILQLEKLSDKAKNIFGDLFGESETLPLKPESKKLLEDIDKKTLHQKRMPLTDKAIDLFGNISTKISQ